MGLMDKLWDEVFPASAPQGPASHHSSAAPTGARTGATPAAAAAGAAASSGAAVNVPRGKLQPRLSLDIPSLERSESAHGPDGTQSPPSSPSPSPLPLSASEKGPKTEFAEGRSSGPTRSQHISIARHGRHSLDSARSLPPGFRYMPDILSPGSGRDSNVWRSVFNPGSTNRDRMDALGASKFDKADPKGPSVYDWFYRAECRPKYR